jgi:predicted NUDIX family NTP pyrophosphohydrolase
LHEDAVIIGQRPNVESGFTFAFAPGVRAFAARSIDLRIACAGVKSATISAAMATRRSAGLLLHRRRDGVVEVLLVHPGGPFWSRKDAGAWTIPKGELAEGEDPLDAARREFREETGSEVTGRFDALPPVRQAGGKEVVAFAVAADFDPAALVSNTFRIEWPPGSGRMRDFPEVDRAAWFSLQVAAARINPAQRPWLAAIATL